MSDYMLMLKAYKKNTFTKKEKEKEIHLLKREIMYHKTRINISKADLHTANRELVFYRKMLATLTTKKRKRS